MRITHNLIFSSESEAKAFVAKMESEKKYEHLLGSPVWCFSRNVNVVLVNDKTYNKLSANDFFGVLTA